MKQLGVVRRYMRILRINVGAHGEELVDEAEITLQRDHVESGHSLGALWWKGGEGQRQGTAVG
jgi:hypothetical protein